jgi:hypothetical protein
MMTTMTMTMKMTVTMIMMMTMMMTMIGGVGGVGGVDVLGGICSSPPPYATFLQSLKRDVKLVGGTILLTCIALMSYNYYLLHQVKRMKKKRADGERTKESKDGVRRKARFPSHFDDDVGSGADAGAVVPSSSIRVGRPTLKSSMSGKSSRSIAADLAAFDGVSDSGNFLSAILEQMWAHMSAAIGNSIKESLGPTLAGLAVPLHFVKLDLGDVPIRTTNMTILRVRLGGGGGGGADDASQHGGGGAPGYARPQDAVADGDSDGGDCDDADGNGGQAGIQINVDVVWDGNCDVMLQATLTKSAKVTFGVDRIKLSGRLHVLLSPLTSDLPVVSAVQYGFTNPPKIEMRYAGAAGAMLNAAQSTLAGVIDSCLAGLLVLPNRMVVPMDLGRYDFLETYRPPVGMVRLAALRGRGFKLLRGLLLNDIPDVYCVIRLGASESFRTSTRMDDLSPEWDGESRDFVLYDMDQKVYVDAYDEDVANSDDLLGRAEVTCRELFGDDGGAGNADDGGTCELELQLNGAKTGCYVTINAELFHLTDELRSFASGGYDGKDRLCGLATIVVTKAFGVNVPRADAATYVKVQYGGEGTPSKFRREFSTGTVTDYPGIDALNPIFDCAFHVPLTSAMLGTERQDCSRRRSGSSPAAPPAPAADDRGGGDGDGGSRRRSLLAMAGSVSTRVLDLSSLSTPSKDRRRWNDVIFTLIDIDGANGTPGHGVLGMITVTHDELLSAYRHTITETRPIGDGGATLEFRISLNGNLVTLYHCTLSRTRTSTLSLAVCVFILRCR